MCSGSLEKLSIFADVSGSNRITVLQIEKVRGVAF